MEAELVDLEGELASLNNIRDVRIQQGLDITEVSGSIVAVDGEIDVKEAEIVAQEDDIEGVTFQITAINTELLFENNFTTLQLANLNNFIIGNTYTNTNYISTSLMSEVDVQNISQELYDQAVDILGKVSEPRYGFDVSSVNFLFLKEFEPFISQVTLGCTITVDLGASGSTTAVILGIDYSYDDPSDFAMHLGNRMRMDDEEFQYSDLFSSMVDASTTTDFNSQKWNNTSSDYSSVVGTGNRIVTTTTQSSTNNIALFSDTTGTRVQDVGALYSSGSFTPRLASGGASFTYNYQVGVYNLVGKTVSFEAAISVSGVSGTTTNALSVEMPITLHKNLSNLSASFKPVCDNVIFGAGTNGVSGLMASNGSAILLYTETGGAALSAISASAVGASTKIYISGQYQTS